MTSLAHAKAFGEAKARGVEVRVVLVASHDTGSHSSATCLAHHRVPVWIDDPRAIPHDKVMVIDADTAIAGSFRLARAAEQPNAEKVTVPSGDPAPAAP